MENLEDCQEAFPIVSHSMCRKDSVPYAIVVVFSVFIHNIVDYNRFPQTRKYSLLLKVIHRFLP